jgi:hypothetical protein
MLLVSWWVEGGCDSAELLSLMGLYSILCMTEELVWSIVGVGIDRGRLQFSDISRCL